MENFQGHPLVHECTRLVRDCRTCMVYRDLAQHINRMAAQPLENIDRDELCACRRALRSRPPPGELMSRHHRFALAEVGFSLAGPILGEPWEEDNGQPALEEAARDMTVERFRLLLSLARILEADELARQDEPLPLYTRRDPRQPPPYEELPDQLPHRDGPPIEETPHEEPPPYEREEPEDTER